MRLFGTDGLRGRAGVFPLDPASLERIGRELGRRVLAAGRPPVVLGGDTRESTRGMIAGLAAGLSESGCAAASAGIMTTPGIAELVLACRAGAGVSVSASHNPYEDNGVKIFGPDGRKWPDAEEESLEEVLLRGRDGIADAPARGDGPAPLAPDPKLGQTYLDRLAAHMPADLAGLAIVVDAGNGAAYDLGPRALVRAGARVMPMSVEPDGRNINAGCGALHPDGMARRTRESHAAMGVALDGDADRSIFADETGRILDGDDVLWIVAREWKRQGRLAPGGVVGTVMSNFGLEAALEREGIAFHRAAVGDRNVARLMEETDATIGGETSGHILLSLSPVGDGILTCLTLGRILSESGGPLSHLATLDKVPQALRNVRAARRVPLEDVPAIREATRRAEKVLEGRGRVYLRYSGTEALLRILVEGLEEREVLEVADELEAVAKRELPIEDFPPGFVSATDSIRAILFDAGGTLIHVDGERLCGAAGLGWHEPAFRAAESSAVEAVQSWVRSNPSSTDAERLPLFLEMILSRLGVPPEGRRAAARGVVAEHARSNLWSRAYPDAPDTLSELARRGYRMGVISNADGRVRGLLETAGLSSLFELVLDSSEVGLEKPDPRIFLAATDRLRLEPRACAYVGDIYEIDVVGARRAGLEALLIGGGAAPDGTPRVANLSGLLEVFQERRADSPLREGKR